MSVSVESSLQLSSNQKTLPTYIEIFTATPNKIESSTVKKIVSASVCKKNCAMSAEKYQPRLYNGRYRLLYLLFNPGIIFGICIRKCSIGVIRWCFIFKLRLVISWPTSTNIFFDQYRWIMFYCRGWLMFSLPRIWKHADVGRNTSSVEVEWKNLADLHCKFWPQHRTK